MSTYYIVCWVGNGRVDRCGHEHQTIGDAEACCAAILGRFIRTIDGDVERSLSDEEFEVWRRLQSVGGTAQLATPDRLIALIANSVCTAKRRDGRGVVDAMDVKEWLLWLQKNAARARTWEAFIALSDLKL